MREDIQELVERVDLAMAEIEILLPAWQDYVGKSVAAYYEGFYNTQFRISVQVSAPIPTAIRVKARTIANEFKSCLDALTVALAARNGNSPRDVYFPSPKSEEIFLSDGMKKKLAKLSSKDRTRIADLRPYAGGHPYLYALHEVDRKGKHQGLVLSHSAQQVIIGGRGYSLLSWGENVTVTNGKFDGNRVGYLKISNQVLSVGAAQLVVEGADSSVPIELSFTLNYSDPAVVNGWNVFDALRAFGSTASEIIRLFA